MGFDYSGFTHNKGKGGRLGMARWTHMSVTEGEGREKELLIGRGIMDISRTRLTQFHFGVLFWRATHTNVVFY